MYLLPAKYLLIFSIASLIVLSACTKKSFTIYVIPTYRNDFVKKPVENQFYVKSVSHAVKVADSLFQSGYRKVQICLLSGEHKLNQTLIINTKELANKNNRLSFTGESGKAIVSGAKKILNDQNRQGKYSLNINSENTFFQLFADDQRKYLAKYPDDSLLTLPYSDSDSVFRQKYIPLSKEIYQVLNQLSEEEKQKVYVKLYHKWMSYNYKIEKLFTDSVFYFINDKAQKISLLGTAHDLPTEKKEKIVKAIRSDRKYFAFPKYLVKVTGKLPAFGTEEYPRMYIEGIESLINKDNEWSFSGNNIVCLSNKKSRIKEFHIPELECLVKIQGDANKKINNINFEGIQFKYTSCITDYTKSDLGQAANKANAAIEISNAANINFTNCTFKNLGSYALWFSEGATGSKVEKSVFTDLGAGALKVGAINKKSEQPSHITISDCIIKRGGRIFPNAVAVWLGNSPDNKVLNNEISDFYYTAISVGWTWGYHKSKAKNNLIKGNKIYTIGQQVLSDLGGIYTLGQSEGTRVENNLIYDVSSYIKKQCSGIYADEGSSYINFENNIIHDCSGSGFHLHYGKENIVKNNVIAFNGYGQIRCSGAEQHKMLTIQNNIICFKEKTPLIGPWNYVWAEMNHNCYWREGGKPVYFAGRTLQQWQLYNRDEYSIIQNPQLTNITRPDFKIKNKEILKTIEFKPFNN